MARSSHERRAFVYCNELGDSPFESWFQKLDMRSVSKVDLMIRKACKGLAKNIEAVNDVYEMRDKSIGPGFRVYFQYDGKDIILLLAGGNKKTQKQDIKLASTLWNEYKNLAKPNKDMRKRKC